MSKRRTNLGGEQWLHMLLLTDIHRSGENAGEAGSGGQFDVANPTGDGLRLGPFAAGDEGQPGPSACCDAHLAEAIQWQ